MMGDLAYALVFLGGGAFLSLHCSRAARVEFRSGIAKGQYAEYRRMTQPVEFWFVIVATALAAVMGVLFMAVGFVALLAMAQ